MDANGNAIIDCRVSNPEQLKGGGLEAQEAACRLVAERMGVNVIKVFKKSHSGATLLRDDFDEVIAWIKASKTPIHFYIIKSTDRLTRAGFTEYERMKSELAKVGVQLIDSYGIIQGEQNSLAHLGISFKWSRFYPSAVSEMFSAHAANAELRDILTRMVGGSIMRRRDGYAARRPIDGMENEKTLVDGKKRAIRVPNERAHFFQKMFELRASGMDDQTIVDRLNAIGFCTRTSNRWDRKSDPSKPRIIGHTGGNLLTVKQLQRYIVQTEYAGVIYEKWTQMKPVRAHYDSLVSIDQFNKANRSKIFIKEDVDGSIEILFNYSPWAKVKHLKDNPEYPWKVVSCPLCPTPTEMLGSASKGKSGKVFPAYHCGGMKLGKRTHKLYRVPKKEFEENVCAYLDALKFEDGFLAALELHLVDQYRSREQEILTQAAAIGNNVSELKIELAQKIRAFEAATTSIIRKSLERDAEKLEERIEKAEGERDKIEITEKSIRAFRREAQRIMEHPSEILTNASNLYVRRLLWSLFFEKNPTYAEVLNGTPKLSCLFKLSEEFKHNDGHLVTLRRIELRFRP